MDRNQPLNPTVNVDFELTTVKTVNGRHNSMILQDGDVNRDR